MTPNKNHKIVCNARQFLDHHIATSKAALLTISASLESAETGLSNEPKIVNNGALEAEV